MKNLLTKTKVLATLGPVTNDAKNLEKLIDAGIDAIRLNFSHGDHELFEKVFATINDVCVKKKVPIPILVDLQGPKIRIGELLEEQYEIFTGDTIEITVKDIKGTNAIVSTSYKQLVADSSIGNKILIDDGLLNLKIIEKKEDSIVCEIIKGGILKPRKGMNMPGMKLSTPSLTEKDKDNLEFALNHRVDYIALSFVRDSKEIIELREWLTERGKQIPIIAKIETEESIENFDKILEATDGIMVARGDLGVELSPEAVPVLQKQIIHRCNEVGKIVITATQMLESMISNPVPTRAEVSDVANAVLDRTDVVMLSAESSVGKFPYDAVRMMKKIVAQSEVRNDLKRHIKFDVPESPEENLFDSVGHGVTDMAAQMNAAAIVVFTEFGKKAKLVSKFKPNSQIYAFTNNFDTMNNLNMYYGIKPFFLKKIDDEKTAIKEATEFLKSNKFLKKGDLVLFTAGSPNYSQGRRHWVQFAVIS